MRGKDVDSKTYSARCRTVINTWPLFSFLTAALKICTHMPTNIFKHDEHIW